MSNKVVNGITVSATGWSSQAFHLFTGTTVATFTLYIDARYHTLGKEVPMKGDTIFADDLDFQRRATMSAEEFIRRRMGLDIDDLSHPLPQLGEDLRWPPW